MICRPAAGPRVMVSTICKAVFQEHRKCPELGRLLLSSITECGTLLRRSL